MPSFGKPSAPAPESEPERELDEFELVVANRTLNLLDLGFALEDALELSKLRSFDWHEAKRLLEKGATHEWVVGYLRD